MVCKRSQHIGPNNVASCWPTMLRAFARAFIIPQLLLTRTIFHYTFFWQEFLAIFIPRCLPLFAFHLFALNLEFEPNTRRELFLTWCRDAGCERSPSEQGFHSIFVEKRQLAVSGLFENFSKETITRRLRRISSTKWEETKI